VSSKNEFLKAAISPKIVKVSVYFEAARPSITDQVDVIQYIKQMQIRRVVYAADLKVDQIGRCLRFFDDAQGRSKSETMGDLMAFLKSMTGRQLVQKEAKVYTIQILRLIKSLEVVDDELYLTLDGQRLLGYCQNNRTKFLDYLGWLLLTRAGWVKVVSEIEQLRRGMLYGLSMKHLVELLVDNLKKDKLLRRTDSWHMSALIDCLVTLRILKPWDPVQMRYDTDKERLYDLLVRKTFT
jgi:hypothetical protein